MYMLSLYIGSAAAIHTLITVYLLGKFVITSEREYHHITLMTVNTCVTAPSARVSVLLQ